MAGNQSKTTAPQGRSEGRFGKGQGLMGMRNSGQSGAWEPTVTFLLILVLAEIFAYGYLRYAFRNVHGG